jgi:hypothetical protein
VRAWLERSAGSDLSSGSWVGVDLDGTLAEYDGWQGEEHIGAPIPAMLARVKGWLKDGHPKYGRIGVKIFTARVADPRRTNVRDVIEAWCLEHVGQVLEVTNVKDYGMVELWDDRAVQVEANTGRRMDGQPDPEGPP